MRTANQALATVLLLAVHAMITAPNAAAHFAWVAADDTGHALLFFSEGPSQRDYHLPEAVAAAEVFSEAAPGQAIEMQTVEDDGFVGRRAPKPVDGAVYTTFTYGNYHGTLLRYYAKHVSADNTEAWAALKPTKGLRFDGVPRPAKNGVELTVYWEGEPVPEAEVMLLREGEETAKAVTNAEGTALFETRAEGLVGFLLAYTDDSVSGEVDGEPYTSESHYATITCSLPSRPDTDEVSALPPQADADEVSALPPLPQPIASFGGAVAGDWLYVYSGHIGTEHEHSRENLSGKFLRIALNNPQAWEELPMQMPLQGLALVPHNGRLYRVGGLDARNAPDDDEDLHSVDSFAAFDPETKTWAVLPALPEPRSSHDAVVVGDKLYVAGGWKLSGDSDGEWQPDLLVYDLATEGAAWKTIAEQPFRRRALTVGHFNNELYVIGGITDESDVSRQVDILNPATGTWRTGPELPGEGMEGFGVSAWNHAGRLYVSGFGGVLHRLAEDGSSWQPAAELTTPRFFHRLLPGSEGRLIAIAGASMQGHLATSEWLAPRPTDKAVSLRPAPSAGQGGTSQR